jgi:hypothetical protein
VTARTATSNVVWISLQPNRSHRVDRPEARRYISLRSRAAAGIGRRKPLPSSGSDEGARVPESVSPRRRRRRFPGDRVAWGQLLTGRGTE